MSVALMSVEHVHIAVKIRNLQRWEFISFLRLVVNKLLRYTADTKTTGDVESPARHNRYEAIVLADNTCTVSLQ